MTQQEIKQDSKKGPAFKSRKGNIEANVWENTKDGKNGEKFTVQTVKVHKNYNDGKEWKTTDTLGVNEVPKAIEALKECYNHMLTSKKDNTEE